jgi:hypothetical protein
MNDLIEKIPGERRWKIATEKLTGAVVAYVAKLKSEAGENAYNEFTKVIWYQTGADIKDFLDNLVSSTQNAMGIQEALNLQVGIFLGTECEMEIAEAGEDRCVTRMTKCAWHERWKELGLTWDLCSAGHQSMGEGAVQALNKDFVFKLTKNMVRGDSCCEFVIERKSQARDGMK